MTQKRNRFEVEKVNKRIKFPQDEECSDMPRQFAMLRDAADNAATKKVLQKYIDKMNYTRYVPPIDILITSIGGIHITLQHLLDANSMVPIGDVSSIELARMVVSENTSIDACIKICQMFIDSKKEEYVQKLEMIKDWTVKKPLGMYLEYARQILKVQDVYETIAKLTARKITMIEEVALTLLTMSSIKV
jgi:hypothetical protein